MGRFEWWYFHSSLTTGCRVNWQMSSNGVFITAPFDVSSNISASSGRRRMGIPPFDSSRFAGSNGSIFILLRPLDAELFDENSKWRSTECDKNAEFIKFCQLTLHSMVSEYSQY